MVMMTLPVRRDWCEEHNRGDLSATDGLCPDCEARSAANRAADPPSLSPAAEKLLERVSNPRNWYAVGAARTPRAMQELVEAGLVRIGYQPSQRRGRRPKLRDHRSGRAARRIPYTMSVLPGAGYVITVATPEMRTWLTKLYTESQFRSTASDQPSG